jgi:ABC-type phosphate transport system substrate-binding protein
MRRTLVPLALLGAAWLLSGPRDALAASDFKVIVHASNPSGSLTAPQLDRLFLKKDTRWESGDAVEPVDQSARSSARAAFSTQVHRKDVGAVKSYWQQQVFSGRGTPPPEMSSDAEVVAFVRSHAGAIGYVSSAAAIGDGVKVVRLTD